MAFSRRPAEPSADAAAGPVIPPHWRIFVVSGFVILTLLALALVPIWVHERTERRWREITGLIEPLHTATHRLELAVAREAAATRGYLLTGDPVFVESYRSARDEEAQALRSLGAMAPSFAPEMTRLIDEARTLADRWHRRQEAWFAGDLTREEAHGLVAAQNALYERTLLTTGTLVQAISREAEARRDAILQFERAGRLVAMLLAVAALLAVCLVAWLARKGARARAEAETRRAEAETAERRYRALFEVTPDPIYELDPEGRLTDVNPALEHVTGRARDELLGRTFLPLVVPDQQERAMDAFLRVLGGEPRRFDLTILRGDGGRVDLAVTAIPATERGRIVGVFGIAKDVSDAKRTERERERRLWYEYTEGQRAARRARAEAALRHAAAAAAATFSPDEVIEEIAKTALTATAADVAFVERLHGPEGDLEVMSIHGGPVPAPGSHLRYAGSLAQRVLERGEILELADLSTAKGLFPEGHDPSIHAGRPALAVPLQDSGEPVGLLVLSRDPESGAFDADAVARARTIAHVAELALWKIRLLRESEERREELERVTESRARLMRGFSHDVKNPLGAADGHLQLIEMGIRGEIGAEQRESIGRARLSIRSALSLIDDLVELARAEAGVIITTCSVLDLPRLVRESTDEYRAEAETHGLDLDIRVPDTFPTVRSDDSRIRQVLGNLISNAIKYTDGGRITVGLEERKDAAAPDPGCWACIVVSDTGPGIPREKQAHVFQEFTRLEPGATKGAGLGLAISQRIAHALGGRITLESEQGRGSTFTLWLPIEDAAAAGV